MTVAQQYQDPPDMPVAAESEAGKQAAEMDVSVCYCFKVGISQVMHASSQGGLQSMESFCERTKAGNGCGGCRFRLQRLFLEPEKSRTNTPFCRDCGSLESYCRCDLT